MLHREPSDPLMVEQTLLHTYKKMISKDQSGATSFVLNLDINLESSLKVFAPSMH